MQTKPEPKEPQFIAAKLLGTKTPRQYDEKGNCIVLPGVVWPPMGE